MTQTHDVFNQPPLLENYNLFSSDRALVESVERSRAQWATADLQQYGERCGRADTIQLGFQANENPPRLRTHDPRGFRIDRVDYHPAYHQLMDMAISQGIHSLPWTDPRPGAHVARAAYVYMQAQVEAGHGCPLTMTFAALPTLRKEPKIAEMWEPLLTARHYDPRNVPVSQKRGVTIGMGMTEKQGGSDVRANTTRATPINGGHGELYSITGHKYFFSAPMSDAFLVLAQAPGGLSCFLVPRWRPDDSKNPIEIQQLKNKVGNVSNASAEVEFRGADGWLIGDERRGVPNIIEMVALTRFDCMVASAAGMRQAVAQAIHHASHREAFGKRLVDQPLMQNVLADLALESEAALAMSMRAAHCLDNQHDERERLLFRLLAPIGKYWICKRTPGHAYEAMECIGGRGAIEDSIMPRLYREAPINAIWEGSGNIQCLDVFRAIQKQPEVLDVFMDELREVSGAHREYDQHVQSLEQQMNILTTGDPWEAQAAGRRVVESMALAFQARVLLSSQANAVSEAFCASRLNGNTGGLYGTLPDGASFRQILERAGSG
ncbi:isovaleryl-CoA dehydrogenase [Gilvimarinus sp. F26214L]|uniref:isovaleryl-CoA dehydrogenase n=1 Tax=Gilvimarinus sp. DZF01 TaxID=3461371 RepID=UPI0040455217